MLFTPPIWCFMQEIVVLQVFVFAFTVGVSVCSASLAIVSWSEVERSRGSRVPDYSISPHCSSECGSLDQTCANTLLQFSYSRGKRTIFSRCRFLVPVRRRMTSELQGVLCDLPYKTRSVTQSKYDPLCCRVVFNFWWGLRRSTERSPYCACGACCTRVSVCVTERSPYCACCTRVSICIFVVVFAPAHSANSWGALPTVCSHVLFVFKCCTYLQCR